MQPTLRRPYRRAGAAALATATSLALAATLTDRSLRSDSRPECRVVDR
ncbi:hypothetical protein GS582_34560 [Rhodococcus hoagii]|nr:hypothetical protein [Prescottella equi]